MAADAGARRSIVLARSASSTPTPLRIRPSFSTETRSSLSGIVPKSSVWGFLAPMQVVPEVLVRVTIRATRLHVSAVLRVDGTPLRGFLRAAHIAEIVHGAVDVAVCSFARK